MKELVQKVKQWGIDRGLDKVGHLAQAKYTLKETAELLDAYADSNIEEINDAIGDILVTLIVGASNDDDIRRSITETLSSERITFSREVKTSDEKFVDVYSRLIYNAFYLNSNASNEILTSGVYGSCLVALNDVLSVINYEFLQRMTLRDCLQLAYNEIKDRTGNMVNGQFIKD